MCQYGTGPQRDLVRPVWHGAEVRQMIRQKVAPGVYFTGLASAVATFGPLMRFLCGSGFAARRASGAVAGRIRAVSRG